MANEVKIFENPEFGKVKICKNSSINRSLYLL